MPISKSVLSEITHDDIKHNDLRMIADELGLEVALSFYEKFAGINILVPFNALREFQIEYIKKNYNKLHTKELALRLGISDRMVQEVLFEHRKERQIALPMDGD
ncbi:MAG: hypothetical protein JNL32_02375 [Candidatus Kapabacteria bacterium]|nr:hypothetical protein [Candidatus Kapabacteria bacterium]